MNSTAQNKLFMDKRVKKYLEDIKRAIWEIQITTEEKGRQYNVFLNDFVYRKFVERNIEIIGEAMNRILKIHPEINITSARKVVDTRNYVIHSYDSLLPDILWSIVINHLPKLKKDIDILLSSSETDK